MDQISIFVIFKSDFDRSGFLPITFLEIAREKSLEALASFDQESKLKHIDVKEKNTLPTKEQILLEKQNK